MVFNNNSLTNFLGYNVLGLPVNHVFVQLRQYSLANSTDSRHELLIYCISHSLYIFILYYAMLYVH